MCNFLEYKGTHTCEHACGAAINFGADTKVVYRRYASLFFVCGIGSSDNELVTLEIIHRYVEVLDRYFGNVGAVCFACSVHSNSMYPRSANWICEITVVCGCTANGALRTGSLIFKRRMQ